MLSISNELKTAFLTDSTKKNLKIVFEEGHSDFSRVNFYNVDAYPSGPPIKMTEGYTNKNLNGNIFCVLNPTTLLDEYLHYADYLYLNLKLCVSAFSSSYVTPSYFRLAFLGYDEPNGSLQYYKVDIPFDEIYDTTQTPKDITFLVPTNTLKRMYSSEYLFFWFLKSDKTSYPSSEPGSYSLTYYQHQVKLQIGDDINAFPYQNDVQVEYEGLDINDYITIDTREPIPDITNSSIVSESFSLSESLSTSNVLKFGATESARCEFEVVNLPYDDLVGRYFNVSISCDGFEERVPLGRFRVRKVTKRGSHDIVTKKIEGYDGIYPLSRDGSDWYSYYVGAMNTEEISATKPTKTTGFDYSRQLFSTLYNVLNFADINLEFSNNVEVTTDLYDNTSPYYDKGQVLGKRITYYHTDPDDLAYQEIDTITYSSTYYVGSSTYGTFHKYWRVNLSKTFDYETPLSTFFEEGRFRTIFGTSPKNGAVLVYELDDSQNIINKFCVNDGDWFALSNNCYQFIVGIPKSYEEHIGGRTHTLTLNLPNTLVLEYADFNQLSSDNLSVRLVYYNWRTMEIGTSSNVTLRDIIRSLIEVTGYFFRYGRDGEIEFISCATAGLYPSNTLYPDDDLYPRVGLASETVAMNKYREFECDDRSTNNFGKIQIQAPSASSEETSVKTYTGNSSKPNTYIIDNNVFYCSDKVSYTMNVDGTESLPEVVTMLSNLYTMIQSVSYVPCEVLAIGMPWFECGDRIGLLTKSGGFETFIFNRRLYGIQSLKDEYSALGEENTEKIPEVWKN